MEPASACILLYPHNPGTFCLEKAVPQFMAIVRAIANQGKETVVLFCQNDECGNSVRQQLAQDDDDDDNKNITVLTCRSSDSWARDTAPTFVFSSVSTTETITRHQCHLVGLDWDFNAYGGENDGCY